jgi:peptidoglycan/xylan/chitin deacetylase (PgdA/CDA1 family)
VRRRDFLSACALAALMPACGAGGEGPLSAAGRLRSALGTKDRQREKMESAGSEPSDDPTSEPVDAVDAAPGSPGADPAGYPSQATEWGERVTGVRTRLATEERVVALTFDACGGGSGGGYDEDLIAYLSSQDVPATLFFNKRWIDANERTFRDVAENSLFAVGNHGSRHLPLSVNGRSAYGIPGTTSPAEVVDEIMDNQNAIERLTGRRPQWFRSGTAFYDEVAVRIAQDLGLDVVNYDVLGDAGATFTEAQVAAALTAASPGSIALLHMNQPTSGTAGGVRLAVPELRDRGFEFVRLGEYALA